MINIKVEMAQSIERLEREGMLNGRKIVLFSFSDYSDRLISILEQHGYSVYAIIDNNINIHNRIVGGTSIRIWHTDKFFEKYDNSYIFLLMSGYYEEMKNQLEAQGYMDQIHIFQIAKIDKSDLWHTLNDTRMSLYLSDIKEGRELHKQLLGKYGPNIKINLWLGQSLGDIYLMGCYIKEYLKAHQNCLFIFARKATQQLAEDLGFEKTLYIQKDKAWTLVFYAKVCGFDKVNIELFSVSTAVHFRIESKMLNYIKSTLLYEYREIFELPDYIKPDIQRLNCQNNIDEYFEKYGLIKGKTVILAPNAQTIPLLPDEFWETLANRLCEKGFDVCTNVASKDEYAIRGTIPVFIKLNDIQEFAEKAGYFVSLRSGLCDILCNCNCKKIILYHFILDVNMEKIQFFSLKNMGFNKNLFEYGINQENEAKIIEQILDEIV